VADVKTTSGRWVCLDVGETLIDESRVWETWAEILGVTRFTFMAAMGAMLARGRQFDEVFTFLGVTNRDEHRAAFNAAYGGFQERDLYGDAKPALDTLRGAGYKLAIIANQPAERTEELRFLGVRADVMGMSSEMGVHKPAPEFYVEALRRMGDPPPTDVAYVGDRLDNDINPAAAAGMRAVWIKRGPWAAITDEAPPPGTLIVTSLTELTERIGEAWA
jgi:HAD superfamily hydrolase (TIGR01662 family)